MFGEDYSLKSIIELDATYEKKLCYRSSSEVTCSEVKITQKLYHKNEYDTKTVK